MRLSLKLEICLMKTVIQKKVISGCLQQDIVGILMMEEIDGVPVQSQGRRVTRLMQWVCFASNL
jgi:hypothetical protein